MIEVYRLVKKRWAASAFDGEGAKLAGGRWNNPGIPAVYASANLSLSVLEVLVNTPSGLPQGLAFVRALIPDGVAVEHWNKQDLPPGWDAIPGPPMLRDLGDAWLRSREALALRLPSAVNRQEYNYLLNPAHPDFPKILIDQPVDFYMDRRIRP